jgi:hypothetical protein
MHHPDDPRSLPDEETSAADRLLAVAMESPRFGLDDCSEQDYGEHHDRAAVRGPLSLPDCRVYHVSGVL